MVQLSYSSEVVMSLDWQVLLKSTPDLIGWICPWCRKHV